MIRADQLAPRILGAGTVPERGRRNLEALDGIRGIAVLTVMLSHFERFLPDGALLTPLKAVLTFGWIGVDLFFVLSGFLITGILMQTRTAFNYFGSFYARRFLRIFPIYYATLAVVVTVIVLVPTIPNVPPAGERWLYFAYLDNWIPLWTHAWPPNVLGHFWSLAVEEQFYLIWPVCVLFISPRWLFRTAFGLSIVALVLRCVWVGVAGPNDAVMFGTFTRMDSLLIGAVAAIMFARAGGASPPKRLPLIGTIALAMWVIGIVVTTWHATPSASFTFVSTIGYSLMAVGFGALVLGAALGDGKADIVQRIFRNNILRRVGKYSYGMYVYHVPLLGICELILLRHLPIALSTNPFFAVLYVVFLTVATFGIAAISYELVERPILALKTRVEPVFSAQDPSITDTAV